MHPTIRQLFKLGPLLIGAIVVAGMLIFYSFNRETVHNELVALNLLPRPEKLTELYFNNAALLPDPTSERQSVNFAFVIHNLETTDFQYVYVVSVNANGTRLVVDRGQVLLKNNQYFVKKEKFNLMKSSVSQDVVIELTNMRQSIDFWTRGLAK